MCNIAAFLKIWWIDQNHENVIEIFYVELNLLRNKKIFNYKTERLVDEVI